MYRHVARLHLDLVQLWRCPIAWCTTWKGSPQDCLEHVRSGHDAPWVEKTASIEKYAPPPPWTVRRQLWIDLLRIEHSGISTDMLLFSEVGMPLTQHYRVYKGGLPHAVFCTDYLPRLRALLPSPGGTDHPSVDGCGLTPTSVRRHHRVSRPKRLFPDSAVGAPILTEQNPAEMIGETVIDCRPSILPVSIPLSGLSPETISEARDCVSYLPVEETGQSIMNMDTNEISINRIVGFAWNDGGTDVEDELPSPVLSPARIASPAISPAGPADPYGRGENFDLDLAKVFCDVSVLPSVVTPLVDAEAAQNGTVADYAPPAVPPVESVVTSPSHDVPEDLEGAWIPEFVPDSVADTSTDGGFLQLLREPRTPLTVTPPVSPMVTDTGTPTEVPNSQRECTPVPSVSPVLPAGGVPADPGPDLSREGPFDACDADHDPGQSPVVIDSMAGCQYRMTSYEERVNSSDMDPSYGIHMHDPRVIEYMGAPESARLMGRTPGQNPAEMIGETVIDCRPSILPVSIPLSGLSPETISEARDCVSYLPVEETGQSIMNMDTNEISINRIVGFAWNDGGTDVEDELPSPVLSPARIASPAISPAGPADPYGRGENFDLDLAKVFCDVSVLPSVVTPLVDAEAAQNGTVADYAPPAVPPVESVVTSPSRDVPEDLEGAWIPEFVPDSVADTSTDGGFLQLLREPRTPLTVTPPVSPMVTDTGTPTEVPNSQRECTPVPSVSPVLPAGGVPADPGPDLSREGPFDACDADHDPGQSPVVIDSMAGCQYRMTSYEERVNSSDMDPSYGIHMHDPRVIEYMGAPESARLMGRTPEYWLEHMGHERTIQAALRLHHDASLIMTNIQIMSQLATSFKSTGMTLRLIMVPSPFDEQKRTQQHAFLRASPEQHRK